jgi:transcription elongation factor Elf1
MSKNIDIDGTIKWNKIDKQTQKKLLANVFCGTCGTTTVVKYTVEGREASIVLRGECKQCGAPVARVIEKGWYE